MVPFPDMERWSCELCRAQSFTSHHPFSREARTWRHEAIKNLLAKVLGESLPGSVVRKEEDLGIGPNGHQLQWEGQTFIKDVWLTDPTAAVYLGNGLDQTADVAAMERELLALRIRLWRDKVYPLCV